MDDELSSADRLARACEDLREIDPEDFDGHELPAEHGIAMLLDVDEAVNEK